jgi:hypothetical protein
MIELAKKIETIYRRDAASGTNATGLGQTDHNARP